VTGRAGQSRPGTAEPGTDDPGAAVEQAQVLIDEVRGVAADTVDRLGRAGGACVVRVVGNVRRRLERRIRSMDIAVAAGLRHAVVAVAAAGQAVSDLSGHPERTMAACTRERCVLLHVDGHEVAGRAVTLGPTAGDERCPRARVTLGAVVILEGEVAGGAVAGGRLASRARVTHEARGLTGGLVLRAHVDRGEFCACVAVETQRVRFGDRVRCNDVRMHRAGG